MPDTKTDMKTEYDKLFIGGKWTQPSTSEVIEVHCPATGEYVGKVPMAAAADVDAAVARYRWQRPLILTPRLPPPAPHSTAGPGRRRRQRSGRLSSLGWSS